VTVTALARQALACAACCVMAAGAITPASAQVYYGTVVVEVKDDSGAAVPGADVAITQQETNWTRQGVSGTGGLATFTTVPPGTFTIKVSLSGFKEFITSGVKVAQNDTTRVASTLVVGAVTDTVTVTAEKAVLQTDRADVRTDIESKQLTNLPVPLGRNYQNLFVTIPGVSPPQNMHSVAVNPARGLIFSSGGTTQNSNSIRIEGAISNNPWLPHVAAYIPGLEAIDTVSVVTSTFDADEGLSGGMSANVRIKSGTNEFHGSGFEYFYNQGMKARPYFIPATQAKPAAKENQYGGTLGGPIVRDKLFFFGSYEGTNDRQIVSTFGTVPTAAQRAGDLSGSPTPIYDPLTGAADGSAGSIRRCRSCSRCCRCRRPATSPTTISWPRRTPWTARRSTPRSPRTPRPRSRSPGGSAGCITTSTARRCLAIWAAIRSARRSASRARAAATPSR
jgi:hypothetical protein